ncbi:MAG: HEAT repeat domain-containing protein [Acidimicrobiia bacterium]|nr:HEAT repeat domain-containing protein [Acidimicrobiia bacterium]
MTSGPISPPPPSAAALAQRRRAVLAGHTDDETTAIELLGDADDGTRAVALGALARLGVLHPDQFTAAADDPSPLVRARAAEVLADPQCAPDSNEGDQPGTALLLRLADDPDAEVAETAAWALGERLGGDRDLPPEVVRPAVEVLRRLATAHHDPLCREAAVAALGATQHPDGLDAILAATADKPAVRRRAVLALAPHLGRPGVDDALRVAADDRDWQVRDAAALLVDDEPAEPSDTTP